MQSPVLELLDPDTQSIVSVVELTDELQSLARTSFLKHVEEAYDLTPGETAALLKACGLPPHDGEAVIREKTEFDDLPYRLHSGRELLLMLCGAKPMAYFIYAPQEREQVIYGQLFDRYVARGDIRRTVMPLRHAVQAPIEGDAILEVLTRPGEEWREGELLQLLHEGFSRGWDEGIERREGTLLGYSESEIDAWLAFQRARQS